MEGLQSHDGQKKGEFNQQSALLEEGNFFSRVFPIILIVGVIVLGVGFGYYGWSFDNINFIEKLQKNKEISKVELPKVGSQIISTNNTYYSNHSTENPQTFSDKSVDDTIPMVDGVVVPAISGWGGKVNQHFNLEKNRWESDLDGVSGDDKISLTYCKKHYPNTVAIRQMEELATIHSWCEAYNTSCYHVSTKPMYECVQSKGE